MTTFQLISILQKLDPEGNSELEFPIYTYAGGPYPKIYLRISEQRESEKAANRHFGIEKSWQGLVRIDLHMPEGLSIVDRRKKNKR